MLVGCFHRNRTFLRTVENLKIKELSCIDGGESYIGCDDDDDDVDDDNNDDDNDEDDDNDDDDNDDDDHDDHRHLCGCSKL
ncbi:hypothetical protein PoB_002147700 [Plakobranchus ocellatus]|uniref:Uncharacterized protein n=1 Tax=Plakobranchus ocellatus TaxID=259542 RepID=A0AAV3ZKB0_9GAST|nr:hypothetical protein PoB_002147700 [Plakobranchus ocellatus]